MGGEGSGRLPGPETIAKRMGGNTGKEVTQWLPGIGAVKPEALRSSPVDITGGGGGHTIQEEGSDLTARTYLNFSGNAVTAYDDGTATIVSIDASGADTDTDRWEISNCRKCFFSYSWNNSHRRMEWNCLSCWKSSCS